MTEAPRPPYERPYRARSDAPVEPQPPNDDETEAPPYIRHPHAAQPTGYFARQIAWAYHCPISQLDGAGTTIGIVELGGGYYINDLPTAGLPNNNVSLLLVDGAHNQAGDADGEVALDIQIIVGIAPGANVRVYRAPNTAAGFLHATYFAAQECDVVSISWGSPENSWSTSDMSNFSGVLADARTRGVPVFVASGDLGSTDGTSANVVDYPASDPNAIGCGGTRLTLDANDQRTSEVTWNDNPTQSATGGGVSSRFPGRQVPDIAGNADPNTGYYVVVNGQWQVVGGTSCVAPLYAACYALTLQAHSARYDFMNTVLTNPTICFDVTQGNNGGYVAGIGRDMTTGFGVVDWSALLSVLGSGVQVPLPGGGGSVPDDSSGCTTLLDGITGQLTTYLLAGQ